MATSGRCLFTVRHEVAVFFFSTHSVGLRSSRVILQSMLLSLRSAITTMLLVANTFRAVLTFVGRVSPSMTACNLLKICEGNHHYCHIIQRLPHQTVL